MGSRFSIELPGSISKFVNETTLNAYTIAAPDHQLESEISALTTSRIFENGISDQEMADCCLSGIWLVNNFLDRSHEISQDIHSREGSYWHGVMHRLEADFWNSKYWYRKVGNHPVFETMSRAATWDPDSFVDQCEAAKSGTPEEKAEVQTIAAAEWVALFEYCFENATL